MTQKPALNLTTEQKIKAFTFAIGGLIFIWIFFIPSCSDDKPKETNYTKSNALVASHQFVQERLKSPSTAEWCYGDDQVSQVNDTTFLVNSCVDSQNGFGAMLRSRYSCKITFLRKTQMVNCDDLIIE